MNVYVYRDGRWLSVHVSKLHAGEIDYGWHDDAGHAWNAGKREPVVKMAID